jgi:hypothetical protein
MRVRADSSFTWPPEIGSTSLGARSSHVEYERGTMKRN